MLSYAKFTELQCIVNIRLYLSYQYATYMKIWYTKLTLLHYDISVISYP